MHKSIRTIRGKEVITIVFPFRFKLDIQNKSNGSVYPKVPYLKALKTAIKEKKLLFENSIKTMEEYEKKKENAIGYLRNFNYNEKTHNVYLFFKIFSEQKMEYLLNQKEFIVSHCLTDGDCKRIINKKIVNNMRWFYLRQEN